MEAIDPKTSRSLAHAPAGFGKYGMSLYLTSVRPSTISITGTAMFNI